MKHQEHSSAAAHPLPPVPSWRTEPEIDSERQRFLAARLAILPDIQRGVYPFKEVKLTRADVEWLLFTHEGGLGPVDWSAEPQRGRMGLDLRGADLRGADLRSLPLARMRSGLTRDEWNLTTLEQRHMAGAYLQGADLSEAHLEGAVLQGAHLEGATLRGTHLEEANLFRAFLNNAYLRGAHLENAKLRGTHLEGTYLPRARLQGADLRNAFFDSASNLERVVLSEGTAGCALLADVHWESVNLAVVAWSHIKSLGDEDKARRRERSHPPVTAWEKGKLLDDYHEAVRAHRQLANAMRAQGMNEEAIPFAYRAMKLQRKVLWRQARWGRVEVDGGLAGRQQGWRERAREIRWRALKGGGWLFSYFLDMLAGYGHRPGRSLLIYLLTITGFAACYLVLGRLTPLEALIFSVTAFHGRGFFPGPFALGDLVTALAALEAVMGIFIEISFIATFTQRFFGR